MRGLVPPPCQPAGADPLGDLGARERRAVEQPADVGGIGVTEQPQRHREHAV
jgi:hypothetical protein